MHKIPKGDDILGIYEYGRLMKSPISWTVRELLVRENKLLPY